MDGKEAVRGVVGVMGVVGSLADMATLDQRRFCRFELSLVEGCVCYACSFARSAGNQLGSG